MLNPTNAGKDGCKDSRFSIVNPQLKASINSPYISPLFIYPILISCYRCSDIPAFKIGEKIDDLRPFDASDFVEAIFSE